MTKKKTLYNGSVIIVSFILFLLIYPKPYAQIFMLVAVIGIAFTLANLLSAKNKKIKYGIFAISFIIGFLIMLITSLNV